MTTREKIEQAQSWVDQCNEMLSGIMTEGERKDWLETRTKWEREMWDLMDSLPHYVVVNGGTGHILIGPVPKDQAIDWLANYNAERKAKGLGCNAHVTA